MLFSRFFRRKRVVDLRETRHQEIAELGYTLEKGGQLCDGRRLQRGYTLITPSGGILDNHGMGFTSSYEALTAAKKHAAGEIGGND